VESSVKSLTVLLIKVRLQVVVDLVTVVVTLATVFPTFIVSMNEINAVRAVSGSTTYESAVLEYAAILLLEV
jgi:hypothetical protein